MTFLNRQLGMKAYLVSWMTDEGAKIWKEMAVA
jgi:hypothetical protein